MTTIQVLTMVLSLFFVLFSTSFSIFTVLKTAKTKKNVDLNYTNLTISITLWVTSILLIINFCLIMVG
ncbi:hypothetical protein ACJA28_00630 [Mesomycoplasma moatsii]|uniref:hypothetical protein n=1 Tax=Mesomycoplasma moatsii TaxID=171287 RepID=UPI0003B66E86